MDAMLSAYTVPATDDEEISVKSVLAKGLPASSFPGHARVIGADDGGGGAALPIAASSHWISWHPVGVPAWLVQLRRVNTPDSSVYLVIFSQRQQQQHAGNGGEPDLAAAAVHRVRQNGPAEAVFGFVAVTGGRRVWPTTVIAGMLARRRHADAGAEYNYERARTLRTLVQGGGATTTGPDHEQHVRHAVHLVFLARECLWWRTPMLPAKDLHARMMTARRLIEGEPTAVAGSPAQGFGRDNLAVAYQPRMIPRHARVIVSDVPAMLVGTDLAGIELLAKNSETHQDLLLCNQPAALYEHVITTLSDGQ